MVYTTIGSHLLWNLLVPNPVFGYKLMATRKCCYVLNGPNGSFKLCDFTTWRSTTTSFNCAYQTYHLTLVAVVVRLNSIIDQLLINWMRQCVSGDSRQKWVSETIAFFFHKNKEEYKPCLLFFTTGTYFIHKMKLLGLKTKSNLIQDYMPNCQCSFLLVQQMVYKVEISHVGDKYTSQHIY